MASLVQMKTVSELQLQGWIIVDPWWDALPLERPVGGPVVMTSGHGLIVEVGSDGVVRSLVPQNDIPDDAPIPTYGKTERNGVIGYMCKIDFEVELGGGMVSISPTAAGAHCSTSCGVVEVEVIGRKIIIPDSFDQTYTDEQDSAKREADRLILMAVDAGE